MAERITSAELRELLVAAGNAVEREEAQLNALDSAIGDGDHGITMRIGFQAVMKAIQALPVEVSPNDVFTVAGKAFMQSTGGAIGIILGRALTAAGATMRDRIAIGSADWKLCFSAMEQIVSAVGKAKPGDKTLLDSIHAINQALANVENGVDSAELLSVAAEASERAAESTATMYCKVGRASRLGDRVLGHADPGSVSISIIVRAMADRARDLTSDTFAGAR